MADDVFNTASATISTNSAMKSISEYDRLEAIEKEPIRLDLDIKQP